MSTAAMSTPTVKIGDKVLAPGSWDPLEVIGQWSENVVLLRSHKGQVFAFRSDELTPAPPHPLERGVK